MVSIDHEDSEFKNTGAMCLLTVPDANREDGFRHVDAGNYFIRNGRKCLITSKEFAFMYGKYIDVPIYIFKNQT